MKSTLLLLSLFVGFNSFAVMVDSSLSLSRGADGDMVKISYMLDVPSAVVTIDLQTNAVPNAESGWVSLGVDAVENLVGDANRRVYQKEGGCAAYWYPSKAIPGKIIESGCFRAEVVAWPADCPPDWMVVDLVNKGDNRFYVTTNSLPGGVADIRYRTTKLLMRKIPAAGVTWRMGAMSSSEIYYNAGADVTHYVRLTEDYYAAVYETTCGQYKTVMGDYGDCRCKSYSRLDERAFDAGNYEVLRGMTTAGDYYWPENGHTVSVNSVIGKFRAACGIDDLDLPTDAQWEYAARAGTGAVWPDGRSPTESFDYYLNTRAWCTRNVGDGEGNNGNAVSSIVGQWKPNNWGLYDVIGNVCECCLDRYSEGDAYKATFATGWETGAVTENPKGCADTSVSDLILRGGSFLTAYSTCRLSARSAGGRTYVYGGFRGFRLFCSVSAAVR